MSVKKTISFGLDVDSIDKAIRDVKQFKDDFTAQLELIAELFAEKIRQLAEVYYAGIVVDDLRDEPPVYADVNVKAMKKNKHTWLVVASGQDAVFVEFGAGVSNNTAVGGSLHPWATDNPSGEQFTIGSYSMYFKGWRAWPFKDESGTRHWSYGTPTSYVLYNATQEAIRYLPEIVQEVMTLG